jgi:hypothetical protein
MKINKEFPRNLLTFGGCHHFKKTSTKLSAFHHQISPLNNNIEFSASKNFKRINPETEVVTLFSAVACGENTVLGGWVGG